MNTVGIRTEKYWKTRNENIENNDSQEINREMTSDEIGEQWLVEDVVSWGKKRQQRNHDNRKHAKETKEKIS